MESILDMVTTASPDHIINPWEPCANLVHRSLDRLPKRKQDVYDDVTNAMQRRVLRIGASGFPVLHDVGVSFSDFEYAPRSPGWIEY